MITIGSRACVTVPRNLLLLGDYVSIRVTTMKWEKKGLIYCPDGSLPWMRHTALTPTPFLVDKDRIRILAGFRDDEGVSRLGFVDVAAANPGKVLAVSRQPILDVGRAGTFDDNGVILGDVVAVGDRWFLYYVGFQLPRKAKFLAFTGLAISRDGGQTFQRHGEAPILDRTDAGLFIRALHSVHYERGKFLAWGAFGSSWETIDGRPFPRYNIHNLESVDGIHFTADPKPVFEFGAGEYRLGRPRVAKTGSGYEMFFTKGTVSGDYLPGYAVSADGMRWRRQDEALQLAPSPDGWDSRHLSYATPFVYEGRSYLFYNGNDMGKSGFGWAEGVR